MYHFDILAQPAPRQVEPGEPLLLVGRHWPTVRRPVKAGPVGARSFEESLTSLERLPRMFVEPDGSFVWVGGGDPTWQVDGNLFDQEDELAYVVLKGHCPPGSFDELLRCFGWPVTPMVFQLSREGVYVDEVTFRELAERPPR